MSDWLWNSANPQKIMDELIIRAIDIKILLSKLYISKSVRPEIYPKILKYLWNESFINAINEMFRKCIEYIWKTAIVIPLHKKKILYI